MILPFELDPQIIHHIIYSQAGSIGKAIIELLMNSVDAGATTVRLTMTNKGFTCSDDGKGFANREDVLRYFGRFGTPHQEGDATYGRFRLGRGQIMAHASTEWHSNDWKMLVDTRTMGYSYDLEPLAVNSPGCFIQGSWYESLTDQELMSAVQEVRDLVRYTPISVNLNDRVITRDPQAEKWDYEDEHAYYRVKEDGAVSIYNQGVLVRHDAGHIWGAGGLIVTKKAIGLNVSRTEILRKTCPVWKAIAKQFGRMAEEFTARLGAHRKTEARREKAARDLLGGHPNVLEIFEKEEVITLLPGKRHLSMYHFLELNNRMHHGKVSVAGNGFDVPKAEAIAREGIAQIIHPQTIQRFGCYNPADFAETIQRIVAAVEKKILDLPQHTRHWWMRNLQIPEFIDFETLRSAFIERTKIVTEKGALDKETRRAWTALRWCIQQYAGACSGGHIYRNGRLAWNDHEHRMHILLGESNVAEAWTDGKTYIAININVVRQLKTDALKTVAFIFGLVEHEVSHQGDSLDCGHDEAFYQRYHDISIRMSPERQRYIHMWLMKYTSSMENEGRKASGNAWRERYLVDRVGSGRQKRGLPAVIEDVKLDPVVTAAVPEENMAFIDALNINLVKAGLCPPPQDWDEVIERARQEHLAELEELRQQAAMENALDKEYQEHQEATMQQMESERVRLATILKISSEEMDSDALEYLFYCTDDDDSVKAAWESKPWNTDSPDIDYADDYSDLSHCDGIAEFEAGNDPVKHLGAEFHELLQDGESWWSLERNAAAAGFIRVENYLKWRATGTTDQ